MWHIYIGKLPQLMHVEHFAHVAYMWHLRDIFVADTYLTIE